MPPIVIAYHLIWTAYGWWLPNDPRGSGSHMVASQALAELGQLHHGRKRIQPEGRDVRAFYRQAAIRLRHPLMEIHQWAAGVVAQGFNKVIQQQRYTCYACSIMPDHVHILIRRHKNSAERMIEHLQQAFRQKLIATGVWPSSHPVWARGGWSSFLEHPDDVERTIPYIWKTPASADCQTKIGPS